MKPIAPNTLLQNRYLVVQLIGKGGMGEVYLAVDQRLGSAVALKRTFFSDDEILNSAFEREARTLARLRHPVLPKVSDHFTEQGMQYLVMEHISGDDLAKRLEITNKPFPLSWVLFWSDQLLDALNYLHSYEPPIIHRDIKPQNLKLSDENHIVLLDFGLAKNSVGNTKVTSTGSSIVGYTPHYAPMEQIRGTGTNPRSDLYSLSATIYQLLSNSVPPDALTRADSVLNGMPDPTKPLSSLNPEVPKTISDIILKGMALSIEQRYTDAREMQKTLREAYAEMQNTMTAQTIAFNNSELQNQSISNIPNQSLPHIQQKANAFATEIMNHPVVEQPPGESQSKQEESYTPAKHNSFTPATPDAASQNNFDAAMMDNGQDFGMKTEVIPFEKIPRTENYSDPAKNDDFDFGEPATSKENSKEDDFSFAPEDDFSDKGSAMPATGRNNDLLPEEENFALTETFNVADTGLPVQEAYEPKQEAKTPPPVAQLAQTQKKSGGKGGLIIGLLGAFVVLIVVLGGVGWYVLRPSPVVTVTPTPTPIVESTSTPIATPSIEVTPEPTIQANTNSDNSNSVITSDTNTNSVVNTDVTKSDQKQGDKTGTVPGKPTPTPRIIVTTTPRATPPPAKTPPPPAKTPAKNGRTDILQ